jgi:hypothetical protein
VFEREAGPLEKECDVFAAAVWKELFVADHHLGEFFECTVGELHITREFSRVCAFCGVALFVAAVLRGAF